MEPSPAAAPTGTRPALLQAGLQLFRRKGFDATSTRELAQRADTNIAPIAYHFGSKDGLYGACRAGVGRRLRAVVGAPIPPL